MGVNKKAKREKISDKIKRLKEFCEKYSKLWLYTNKKCDNSNNDKLKGYLESIQDKREREELEAKLKKAIDDYNYIRARFLKGKVDNESITELREAGIGGIFGFKSKLEEISKRCGLSVKRLYELDMTYGGMDKYQEEFIKGDKNKIIPEEEKDYYVLSFDLASPDFNCEIMPLIAFINNIFGDKDNLDSVKIIDSGKVDINEIFSILPEKHREVLELHYGLNNKGEHSFAKIGEKLNISRARSEIIHRKAMNKIKTSSMLSKLADIKVDISEEAFDKFSRRYYERMGIFRSIETNKLDEGLKEELLNIVNKGINKKEDVENIKKESESDENITAPKAIENLNLSIKTYNALKRAGINSIDGICQKSDDDLLKLDRIGLKGVEEIAEKLKVFNLRLKGSRHQDIKESVVDLESAKNIMISELSLRGNICSALKREGIYTLYDLCLMQEEDFNFIKGIGPRGFYDIKKMLDLYGLNLNLGEDKELEEKIDGDLKKVIAQIKAASLVLQEKNAEIRILKGKIKEIEVERESLIARKKFLMASKRNLNMSGEEK